MHYDWERLSDDVYRCRLPFLDVTVGFVRSGEHVLLIDCGTTLIEAGAIADDIRCLSGGVPTKVVLTHHHFDHVLGSAGFVDAEIYAAPAVARALTTGLDELRSQAIQYGADPAEIDRAISAVRPPDHQILRADFNLDGRKVHAESVGRGHTDHDLVVVVPPIAVGGRTVVFCGDLVEESADPSIEPGSDISAWPQTLDRILALGGPDAVYVPGHGAVVAAGFLRRQRDWLAALN